MVDGRVVVRLALTAELMDSDMRWGEAGAWQEGDGDIELLVISVPGGFLCRSDDSFLGTAIVGPVTGPWPTLAECVAALVVPPVPGVMVPEYDPETWQPVI